MIELPEALLIGQQMNDELAGKRIAYGNRGNADHKFAFNSGSTQDYEAILKGKTVGGSRGHGSAILTEIGSGHVLVLGGGGERILYHTDDLKLPKKHHLVLSFEGGSCLTVTVQGWGNTLLLPADKVGAHSHVALERIAPLTDAFTWEHFQGLFEASDPESAKSIKYLMISEPGVWGIGNGCLQDILFHARIHPKRRVADMSEDEQRALYHAIQGTLTRMVDLGGRDSERDLYGNRGGYVRILDSKTKGQPCPECGTAIENTQYLGGTVYFCTSCQRV